MGTRSVRLDEGVYERVMAEKRDDETVSEAIERLLEGPSLSTLSGILSDDEADEFRNVIERVDEDARAETTDTVERFAGSPSGSSEPDESASEDS